MKRFGISLLAGGIVLALSASAAFGVTLNQKQGLHMHGLVSTVYQYSINSPSNTSNIPLRVSVRDPNDISLNQASLFFVREKEGSPWGAAVTMDFGEVAETTISDWNGDGAPANGMPGNSEETNSFELREAYVTYTLENLGGVTLKGGKFVTLMGYEVIKTWDSINHNISESILFGYAIPFTHTGFLVNVPLGEMMALDAGVVNGWDNVDDNNDPKTLLTGLSIAPSDVVSSYISVIFGPEQNDKADDGVGAGSKRWTVTANVVVTPIDELSLIADAVYGQETDLELFDPKTGTDSNNQADWYGGALYAVLQLTDRVSLALRGEIFVDADGVRTGLAGPDGKGVTVWEVTPTVAIDLVPDRVTARFEYRHDTASTDAFPKGKSGVRDSSDTLAFELIGRI